MTSSHVKNAVVDSKCKVLETHRYIVFISSHYLNILYYKQDTDRFVVYYGFYCVQIRIQCDIQKVCACTIEKTC